MGYTNKSIDIINPYIAPGKSVCDLGAQNNYAQPLLPAPYMSEWFKSNGITDYMAIDLNGENDSKKWDLSEPVKTNKQFDIVTDFGTSEHVKDLYQCFANVNKITKVGGYMIHENPKTGNWPGHGFHYRTVEFYKELAEVAGYDLIHTEEHPACWNTVDGWNIIAVMRKTKEGFISKDKFPHAQPK